MISWLHITPFLTIFLTERLVSYLWLKLAHFNGYVNRSSCSWDGLSSCRYTPLDSITIPPTIGVLLFSEEINTVQPATVTLPCLQCKSSPSIRIHWSNLGKFKYLPQFEPSFFEKKVYFQRKHQLFNLQLWKLIQ